MSATASLSGLTAVPIVPSERLLVLIDGAPEPALHLARLTRRAPLDVVSAELLGPADADPADERRWLGTTVTLAWPRRLHDDTVRYPVLAHGRLRRSDARLADGTQVRRYVLDDVWSLHLEADVADANALAEADTIDAALALLSAQLPGGITTALVPVDRQTLRLPAALRGPSVGEALGRVLDAAGLGLRRETHWVAGRVEQRVHVRPTDAGAPVALPWPRDGMAAGGGLPSGGGVTSLSAVAEPPRARRWTARCGGWRVESTFALAAGWDAALEGAADAEYDRGQSSDWPRYAAVYRRWVLNEDDTFDGPAFDLTAFFNVPRAIDPQPIPLDDCLTLDDAGQPIAPLVEVSLDSGATWSAPAGAIRLLPDRAGVVFADAAPEPAYLAAAKAGQARLRVTATLGSPLPVEAVRWQGNPFAGIAEPRVEALGDRFVFRRIDPASVFHSDVLAGTRDALAQDDTAALAGWLARRIASAEPSGEAAVELQLAGARLGIGPGDRVRDPGGAGRDAFSRSAAITGRAGVVQRVEVRLDRPANVGPMTSLLIAG